MYVVNASLGKIPLATIVGNNTDAFVIYSNNVKHCLDYKSAIEFTKSLVSVCGEYSGNRVDRGGDVYFGLAQGEIPRLDVKDNDTKNKIKEYFSKKYTVDCPVHITKIDETAHTVVITTPRPGLFLGRNCQHLNELATLLGKQVILRLGDDCVSSVLI